MRHVAFDAMPFNEGRLRTKIQDSASFEIPRLNPGPDIDWRPALSRRVGRSRCVSVQPRGCPGPFALECLGACRSQIRIDASLTNAHIVGCKLVKSGRDTTTLPDLVEGPFDQVARRCRSSAPPRHDRCQTSARGADARLVDPGFPREPGVIGAADRTTGAREKHRAASKALAISRDAGGNRVSGLWTFDHDHSHVASLAISLCCGLQKNTGRLECACRWSAA